MCASGPGDRRAGKTPCRRPQFLAASGFFLKPSIKTWQAGAILLITLALALFWRTQVYYPSLDFGAAGGLAGHMVGSPRETGPACRDDLAVQRRIAALQCPTCSVIRESCSSRLDASDGDWLSVVAMPAPSARWSRGVLRYDAGDAWREACTKFRMSTIGIDGPILCYPAGVPRARATADWPSVTVWRRSALGCLAAFLSSWCAVLLLLRTQDLHGHLSLDATTGGPQKFHAVPTPRIGGAPILIGVLLAAVVIGLLSPKGERGFIARLVLAGMPAFVGGLIEDLTKRVGVLQRLMLTMAAGALAAWLLGAVIPRLALPGLDAALKWYPFAVFLTILAVAGLANAFNIIDGSNGLAGGTAVIVLLGLAGLALKVGDVLMLQTSLACAAAVLGFLYWNWPGGRIFLGDGGAYLLGFILADLSVQLVVRNPSVSPWCAMMLMAHPVTETLYSIYRRKIHRGHNPGSPDALHLHQLVHQRLLRPDGQRLATDRARLARNSAVAPYFWVPTGVLAVGVQFAWDSSRYPVALTFCYLAAYVWLYGRLTHWRAPRWMIRRLPQPPG